MCVSAGGGVGSQISMMMVSWAGLWGSLHPYTGILSGSWEWPEGGRANFTYWHDAAVPEMQNYNCMQFLSATCYGKQNTKLQQTNISYIIYHMQMDDGWPSSAAILISILIQYASYRTDQSNKQELSPCF